MLWVENGVRQGISSLVMADAMPSSLSLSLSPCPCMLRPLEILSGDLVDAPAALAALGVRAAERAARVVDVRSMLYGDAMQRDAIWLEAWMCDEEKKKEKLVLVLVLVHGHR